MIAKKLAKKNYSQEQSLHGYYIAWFKSIQ